MSPHPNRAGLPRVLAVAVLLVASAAHGAGAQRREGDPPRPPVWWGSLWTGMQVGRLVFDAATTSSWDFDVAPMLRLTLEREFPNRVAVGASWNAARMPLTYEASSGAGCGRCQADATVTSLAGMVRWSGRQRLHQVLELSLGVTRYESFERVSPREALPPADANTDFSFGLGYGFGYTLSRDWQLVLVQEGLTGFHDRPSDATAGTRLTRNYTTRIGARIGF